MNDTAAANATTSGDAKDNHVNIKVKAQDG